MARQIIEVFILHNSDVKSSLVSCQSRFSNFNSDAIIGRIIRGRHRSPICLKVNCHSTLIESSKSRKVSCSD